jgi:cytochrome b
MGTSPIFGSQMWDPEVKLTTWHIAKYLYVKNELK